MANVLKKPWFLIGSAAVLAVAVGTAVALRSGGDPATFTPTSAEPSAVADDAAADMTFVAEGKAAAATHSAVSFTAKETLNGRDGASMDANVVKKDMYKAGATIKVVCQDRGDMAYGSAIWDRTSDGVYVPDAYVKTGTDGFAPGVARCTDLAQSGKAYPATADLNGRAGPSLTARVVEENMYRKGEKVVIVCQITGSVAYGSTIWDKTDDGVYVPDAYVKTGTEKNFAPGIARCTDTAPARFGFKASVDLAGRDAKSVSAKEVKTYAAGSTVYITCQTIGANAYGSNIWDKTVDNLWVADHYLKTGFDNFTPGVPKCAGTPVASPSPTAAATGGTTFPAKVDLAGRKSKSTSSAEVKTYASGSKVRVVCQAYGAYAYGSYIWDKTSDGLWVADYYLKTGTDGFVSDMARCDDDKPTGGPSTSTGTGSHYGDCRDGHGRIGGTKGSTAGTAAQKVARVIAAAKAMTGKGLSYSWGGGGKGGPSCGISSPSPGGHIDYNRYGFDCSGYTLYAYWVGAGVDIGPNTGSQWGSGRVLPYSQRKPGDLIFWFSGGVSVHVAIYLGNNQMLEAAPPRGSSSVHQTSVYGSHASVVRVLS
ncbi:NlpC/P60 family protein [Hamadaea sp. NPDC051192]|uniref:NlpC/P60 family protein n=1 Tax=Hamadaea sp. NPDC051192 TaxID=3154940 RepID=UPI00341FF6B7